MCAIVNRGVVGWPPSRRLEVTRRLAWSHRQFSSTSCPRRCGGRDPPYGTHVYFTSTETAHWPPVEHSVIHTHEATVSGRRNIVSSVTLNSGPCSNATCRNVTNDKFARHCRFVHNPFATRRYSIRKKENTRIKLDWQCIYSTLQLGR